MKEGMRGMCVMHKALACVLNMYLLLCGATSLF